MTTEKLEPLSPCACSWCGKMPLSCRDVHLREWVHCSTFDCLDQHSRRIFDWNREQAAILARRKADFEAGFFVACRTGDGKGSQVRSFEEYLAKERGE